MFRLKIPSPASKMGRDKITEAGAAAPSASTTKKDQHSLLELDSPSSLASSQFSNFRYPDSIPRLPKLEDFESKFRVRKSLSEISLLDLSAMNEELPTAASHSSLPPPVEKDPNGFIIFPHGHKDMVQAVAYNMYGDRFATGSVDGQIKVYNLHNDGVWHLLDTWLAHHSEVLDIQWLPTTIHPHILASIGIDGRFRMWAEDITIMPSNGRRFNSHRESNGCFFELRAPPRAPFLSFAMKHNFDNRHTYLALLNRNAILKIYENEEPEDLRNWNEMDEVKVCEKPDRGEETSFKVRFDPALDPCYNAIEQGMPSDALGLVVASMNKATIWRTKEVTHSSSLGLGDSTRKELYLAAELPGHRALVRDVAWTSNNIRGFDIVATACKDGFLRVFEISTPPKSFVETKNKDNMAESASMTTQKSNLGEATVSGGTSWKGLDKTISSITPSGIGAGLATSAPSVGGKITSTSINNATATGTLGNATAATKQENVVKEDEVLHVVKEVSKIGDHRSSLWKVAFDDDGQVMGSTGDDGKLWLWRRRPDGGWANSSLLGVSVSVAAGS